MTLVTLPTIPPSLQRLLHRFASPPPQAGGVKDLVEWDRIESLSMACPALPLCGLAIGEAERALPDFNARIRALLDRLGFEKSEKFVVRATGESGPRPACRAAP
jgi:hypothetical protein